MERGKQHKFGGVEDLNLEHVGNDSFKIKHNIFQKLWFWFKYKVLKIGVRKHSISAEGYFSDSTTITTIGSNGALDEIDLKLLSIKELKQLERSAAINEYHEIALEILDEIKSRE